MSTGFSQVKSQKLKAAATTAVRCHRMLREENNAATLRHTCPQIDADQTNNLHCYSVVQIGLINHRITGRFPRYSVLYSASPPPTPVDQACVRQRCVDGVSMRG